MIIRPRRNQTADLKAKVVLAVLRGDKTLAELAEQLECMRTKSRCGASRQSTIWQQALVKSRLAQYLRMRCRIYMSRSGN